MKRLIIKVKLAAQTKAVDLEVSGDQPVHELLAHLVQGMGWPIQDPQGRTLYYWFETPAGTVAETATLNQLGVRNGTILTIGYGTSKPTMTSPDELQTVAANAGFGPSFPDDDSQTDSIQERRASTPTSGWIWEQIPDEQEP